jgi:integrase
MKGFVKQRFDFVERGDPACRHEWERLGCTKCSATRKMHWGWTVYYEDRNPATGERRHHSQGGFRTRRLAQERLNVVAGKVAEGTYRPDTPITVAELMRQWLDAQRAKGLRPGTLASYEGVNAWYVSKALGGKRVAALVPGDINAMVQKMETEKSSTGRAGLSARSRQLAVAKLKAATKWALANGMISRDPLAGVALPRVEHQEMKFWSTDDARDFLAHVTGDPLEAAWALFVCRGLRRGEVAGLKWDAVDLIGGTLHVKRTLISVDGKATESTPKTKSSRRSIPIDALLIELLHQRGEAQKADRARAGEAWVGDGHIFTDALGKPWHPDYYGDRFDKLAVQARLPRIRLHDTRHTAATLMLANGVPVPVVAEILGHEKPSITMSLYSHAVPGMGRKAGEELSMRLLGPRADNPLACGV